MKIPWATLLQIAGVLGFFGSILVFIITRFEIRKHITYSIFTGPMTKDAGFAENALDPLLTIQITNSSARPITIDTHSIKLFSRKKSAFSKIEWHVTGEGEGRFRKLYQADSLRFICMLTDFLYQCETLGFKKGKVPLLIEIKDSESKKYVRHTKYNQDKLAFTDEKQIIVDAEPKYKLVDMEYPKRTGLQSEMEAKGFRIAWVTTERIQIKLTEGWEEIVIADRGSRYKLKMQDWPSDQVLMRNLEYK